MAKAKSRYSTINCQTIHCDPPRQKKSQRIGKKKDLKIFAEGKKSKQVFKKNKRVLNKNKQVLKENKQILNENDEEPSKRRKQFRVGDDGKIIFDEEELKKILGFKKGEDYIEVVCGTTTKTFGDYVGKLKINKEGEYFITCECYPGCPLVDGTLEMFEKHASREGSGRWMNNIWVHCEEGDKIPLRKTPLMKYYTHQANVANWKDSAPRKQSIHRDEFVRCTICNKERRFRLKTRPDIKKYHDALMNKSWTCSLWPHHKITCDHVEERPSVKAYRSCGRCSDCKGCSTCSCKGCIKCRFEDCNCQECRDFMLYAKP